MLEAAQRPPPPTEGTGTAPGSGGSDRTPVSSPTGPAPPRPARGKVAAGSQVSGVPGSRGCGGWQPAFPSPPCPCQAGGPHWGELRKQLVTGVRARMPLAGPVWMTCSCPSLRRVPCEREEADPCVRFILEPSRILPSRSWFSGTDLTFRTVMMVTQHFPSQPLSLSVVRSFS